MRLIKYLIAVFGILGISTTSVFAHNGEHGMGLMEGIWHFLSSPSHSVFIIVVTAAVLAMHFAWLKSQ